MAFTSINITESAAIITLLTIIIVGSVWYILTDSIRTYDYHSYWTIVGNGKILKRESGKITLYNNMKVFHGQFDYKVKKIVREGKEIKSVICEYNGVTRVFNISYGTTYIAYKDVFGSETMNN